MSPSPEHELVTSLLATVDVQRRGLYAARAAIIDVVASQLDATQPDIDLGALDVVVAEIDRALLGSYGALTRAVRAGYPLDPPAA